MLVNPFDDRVWPDLRVVPNQISVRVGHFTEDVDHSLYVIVHVFVASVFTEEIVQAAFEPDAFIFEEAVDSFLCYFGDCKATAGYSCSFEGVFEFTDRIWCFIVKKLETKAFEPVFSDW